MSSASTPEARVIPAPHAPKVVFQVYDIRAAREALRARRVELSDILTPVARQLPARSADNLDVLRAVSTQIGPLALRGPHGIGGDASNRQSRAGE